MSSYTVLDADTCRPWMWRGFSKRAPVALVRPCTSVPRQVLRHARPYDVAMCHRAIATHAGMSSVLSRLRLEYVCSPLLAPASLYRWGPFGLVFEQQQSRSVVFFFFILCARGAGRSA